MYLTYQDLKEKDQNKKEKKPNHYPLSLAQVKEYPKIKSFDFWGSSGFSLPPPKGPKGI